MTSNRVCNGVTATFVTLPPTQPDPAQPSPARPMSFGHLPSIRLVGDATAPSVSAQPLAPAPAWMDREITGPATIEGIDLSAEVPCVALRAEYDQCPNGNVADLLVGTHTSRNRYPACRACYDDVYLEPEMFCGQSDLVEPGRVHYHIAEELR